LSLSETYYTNDQGVSSPYYEYFDENLYYNNIDLNDFVNNFYTYPNSITFGIYHNINDKAVDGNKIITYTSQNNPNFHSIGVQKFLGPWASYGTVSSNCLQTPMLTDFPILTLDHAIQTLNDNSDLPSCGMMDVGCDGEYTSVSYAEQIGGAIEELNIEIDEIVWLWEIVEQVEGIANLNMENNGYPYAGISVTELSGQGNIIANLSMDDLLDEEGNWVNIPLTLQKGLYWVNIIMADGSVYPHVDEKTSGNNPENSMSNYLNVNIFPVPIVENYFNMTISASRDLAFEYHLYDFNGVEIYQSDFKVKSGSSETVQIKPECELPSGYYINLFKFPDGSQTSILTTKN